MVQGSWIDYAQKHKAICFQLEHRFYGESHPTEDMSVKNLVYLTSTQALADLAGFITAMNEAHNLTDAKWISFGGIDFWRFAMFIFFFRRFACNFHLISNGPDDHIINKQQLFNH